MPKRLRDFLSPGTPGERHPLLRNQGLGSPSSPLTPTNYASIPRAESTPSGLAGSSVPQRLNPVGRRQYRRWLRAVRGRRVSATMNTFGRTARRLFGPVATARAATVAAATRAVIEVYAFYSAMNWFLFAIGADRFIAHHTTVEDFSLGPDDQPMTETHHPNSVVMGTDDPVAPCMHGYPNVVSRASGTPVAAPC